MNTTQHFFSSATTSNASNTTQNQLSKGYICLLDDQSLIQASGDDAANFLHNQLSNDVEHLTETQARYAAYCTPKGRMLASFLYWKDDHCITLQCAASLQPALQKRLQMFIMRSKAKLEDATEKMAILGLGGALAETFLNTLFVELPSKTNDLVSNEAGQLIRMHDAFNSARYQWIVPHDLFSKIGNNQTTQLPIVDASIWRLGHILAGIPQIVDTTKELFVPQMINFELIGGVNFRKGCYPGQEIVARSQYLGKLKRRMAIATVSATDIAVGMEVFSENDVSQPCGMIVNKELHFDNEYACLVELKLVDQEQGKVHLGAINGPALHFLPLPYAYLDITE